MSDEQLPPDEKGYITIPGGSPFGEDAKIKHNPMFDTDEKSYLSNFAMIIPKGPFVENKPKPISKWKKIVCFLIWHMWGFAGISYMGPSFPRKCKRCKITKWFDKPTLRMRFSEWREKTLNKVWPFCKIGLHRYKSHYGSVQYSFGGDATPTIRQEVYKCSCCKKIKTITF